MKRILLLLTLFFALSSSTYAVTIDSLTYGIFGKVIVYHPVKTPTSVVLFVSGDGGWKDGVINMAKDIANQGALVLGIDAKTYKNGLARSKAECYYPAADFERISLMIQKKYKLVTYSKPILVGYSYGATLIYGILAQAPANTFKGAIALGFCPDIEIKRPLCKGSGLTQHVLKPGVSYWLERTESLTEPFIVLNGFKDQTCPYTATAAFLKGMPMAELIDLPKVGHGFSIADNWLPQFNEAFQKILNTQSFAERKQAENVTLKTQPVTPYGNNLPLIVIPSPKKSNLPMVLMISGDGGWTSFDQSLAEAMAEKGLSVVGLDAQKYFWNTRTPNQTTEDLSKAILHYAAQLGKEKFVLAGYSFGASVVPFVAARFEPALKSRLAAVLALSPDVTADFEIHILDMLSIGDETPETYNVLPEMKKMKTIPAVSFFGKAEGNEIPEKFEQAGLKVDIIPGDHHFDGDFQGIANAFLKFIPQQ
ncbi:AcvB/VirJ family lysyl-phosphatidylglycerol hydrolase [Pedobacter sp. L105]|uniref:AcvB/VirJ family lysyl-phosphatidylglycerol hydrolase n=1 Tax=Pedobacter sp. L105 TaxID=1641871 RepID=UPI00131D7A37|nr:AcvB/VirJ family lysyl-phosphatidylglycerol hydrolase [Pedobacter sp. L105]